MTRRSEWWDGEGPIPDDVIGRMARELELGRWMMRAALYGDEAIVDHRLAKVKAAFERIPGVEVWGTKTTPENAKNLAHPAERIQGGECPIWR
jgi:4-cresol dehydrogenase (hydroxylating)